MNPLLWHLVLLVSISIANGVIFTANTCNWAENPKSESCKQASHSALSDMSLALTSNLPFNPHKGNISMDLCQLRLFGNGYGKHFLCSQLLANTIRHKGRSRCVFYSFGIQRDHTFDSDLSRDARCAGFLFDPTSSHLAKIDTRLTFLPWGANMLYREDLGGAGSTHSRQVHNWFTLSPNKFMKFMNHSHLTVLKMDCEGCEYAVARDVAAEDPRFFEKVSQFTLEVHISKSWIKTDLHLHYLGLLYHMLFREGFYLAQFKLSACNSKDESLGCPQQLLDIDYPCKSESMCHNYLFAKL